MKTCIKCKKDLPFSEFTKARQNKDGYYGQCKACWKAYARNYGKANKEKINKRNKAWLDANPDKREARNLQQRENPESQKKRKIYYETNREKIIEQRKDHYAKHCRNNPEFKKKRSKYYKAYRKANKEKLKAKDRAYTKSGRRAFVDKQRQKNNPLIKLHRRISSGLRSSFAKQGFSKNSQTREILCCSFSKFKSHIEKQFKPGMTWENTEKWHLDHIIPVSLGKTEQEIISLNHYLNFQPLWASENLSKSDKVIRKMITPELKKKYEEMIKRA